MGPYDVIHDVGLALAGATVGGFYALRVAHLNIQEQQAAEYRRRRRDCLEKIAGDFIQISEKCLEMGHVHISMQDPNYSESGRRMMAQRLSETADPLDILAKLRHLRALALIFNETHLAEALAEFIGLDCAMADAINKNNYLLARQKHIELHDKIPSVLAVAYEAHRAN